MHFEDGVRSVLMSRQPSYFHAYFIDSQEVIRRYVLFSELVHFEEEMNIDEAPLKFKKIFILLLNDSTITSLPRIMPEETRMALEEGLELI
jgi:hypothetical protein